jgi:hypothetical protein
MSPAVALYRSAAEKATSIAERNYLLMRAARIVDGDGSGE